MSRGYTVGIPSHAFVYKSSGVLELDFTFVHKKNEWLVNHLIYFNSIKGKYSYLLFKRFHQRHKTLSFRHLIWVTTLSTTSEVHVLICIKKNKKNTRSGVPWSRVEWMVWSGAPMNQDRRGIIQIKVYSSLDTRWTKRHRTAILLSLSVFKRIMNEATAKNTKKATKLHVNLFRGIFLKPHCYNFLKKPYSTLLIIIITFFYESVYFWLEPGRSYFFIIFSLILL